MAKMPGWIKTNYCEVKEGSIMVSVSIRWWHPGAWLVFVRLLWKALMSRVKANA